MVEPDLFFAALAALLRERRAAIKGKARFAFALTEGGRYLVDLGASAAGLVTRQWTRDADVTILTNQRTLSDILMGEFDSHQAGPEHLFVAAGSEGALGDLQALFSGGRSLLQLRAGIAKGEAL